MGLYVVYMELPPGWRTVTELDSAAGFIGRIGRFDTAVCVSVSAGERRGLPGESDDSMPGKLMNDMDADKYTNGR